MYRKNLLFQAPVRILVPEDDAKERNVCKCRHLILLVLCLRNLLLVWCPLLCYPICSFCRWCKLSAYIVQCFFLILQKCTNASYK